MSHSSHDDTSPDGPRTLLREICSATAWVDAVAAGLPYETPEALYAASDAAVRALDDAGVEEAVAGHAVIGRPRPDARSRGEQARVTAAGDDVKEQLAEANLAYRNRFGQVFLICAAGRSPEEMLAAMRERLGNSPGEERSVVREELRKINRARLQKTAAEGLTRSVTAAPAATVSTHVLDTSAGRPATAVPVAIEARTGADGTWAPLGGSATDEDGRCTDLPAPPDGTTHVRLSFDTGAYQRRRGEVFFPEVSLVFAVAPGQHYHVPLLLNPFGYSAYRGS